MREINFRAWNKTRLWMDNVWAIDWEHELLCFSKHNQDFMKHCILMQSTGLKDKNGVEIYEGDIVQFTDFDTSGGNREDREHIGIVKYQSGIYEIWKNNVSEYYGSDGAFILNHAWLQDDEFEVIGNLYEHPHLLEEPT